MQQRGQIQLSFSMIFSIIIIIATLAVSGYVLVKFVIIKKDISCYTFYQDIQFRVNQAYNGDGLTQDTIIQNVPSGTQYLCFGNLTQTPSAADRSRFEQIREVSNEFGKNNIFIYAQKSPCGDAPASSALKHIATTSFFCIAPRDGKVTFRISKTSTEALVTLKP